MTAQPGDQARRGDAAPQPVYSSVEDWVNSHYLPMFRRPLGGEYRWCSEWWRPPRPSPGSPPCGTPGKRCAFSPAPVWPPGC